MTQYIETPEHRATVYSFAFVAHSQRWAKADFLAWLNERERMVAERAWDAAVASLRYEDGTVVEVVESTNPYRANPNPGMRT